MIARHLERVMCTFRRTQSKRNIIRAHRAYGCLRLIRPHYILYCHCSLQDIMCSCFIVGCIMDMRPGGEGRPCLLPGTRLTGSQAYYWLGSRHFHPPCACVSCAQEVGILSRFSDFTIHRWVQCISSLGVQALVRLTMMSFCH